MSKPDDDLPWLVLTGASGHPGPHALEIKAHKGEALLTFVLGGPNPGAGTGSGLTATETCCVLSDKQLKELYECLTGTMRSVGLNHLID